MKDHPEVAAKLENQIRQNAGLVAEAMLAGPESAGDSADEAAASAANDEGPPPAKKKK